MLNHEELGELVDTLSPEDLDAHEELAGVYRAASAIAISSYNGNIVTSPVSDLPVEHEGLVHRLLNRYSDEKDSITFPILRAGGGVMELILSASGVADYTLRQRPDPGTQKEIMYFSSFPV